MDISNIDHFVNLGKYQDALSEISIILQDESTKVDTYRLQLLEAQILYLMGNFEVAILKASSLSNEAHKGQDKIYDILDKEIIIAEANLSLGKIKETKTLIDELDKKASNLHSIEKKGILRKIVKESRIVPKTRTKELKYRILKINNLKGKLAAISGDVAAFQIINNNIKINKKFPSQDHLAEDYSNLALAHRNTGEMKKAIEYSKKCLEIRKNIGNKKDIAYSLHQLGSIHYFVGNFDEALTYFMRGLQLRNNIQNAQDRAASLNAIGCIYSDRYDLEKAHEYFIESIKVREEIDNKQDIAASYSRIGYNYHQLGDYETAIEYYQKGLSLMDESIYHITLLFLVDNIIHSAIASHRLELAKKYNQKIKSLITEDTPSLQFVQKYYSALILKQDKRAINKIKSQELFIEIIEDPQTEFAIVQINSMLNLCELLLIEFKNYGVDEVYLQLKELIARLIYIAESKNLFYIHAKVLMIKSQLAVIDANSDLARKLLQDAQEIAVSKGIKVLAQNISHDLDVLMQKIMKDEFNAITDLSVHERIQDTNIEELIYQIISRKSEKLGTVPNEIPVLLIILTNEFKDVFIKKFQNHNLEFSDTELPKVIDNLKQHFSDESQALGQIDRISYNAFTVMIHREDKLGFYYIYNGPSYHAKEKLTQVVHELKDESHLWNLINAPVLGINDNEEKQIVKIINNIF
ncbi:MAG: tetratricopeptide repeat protein [Candidatus Kariarchaeaceae archaeon]|jgi:tetratricopeptide (TPR) repeat protein